jgi:hypothetical protein
MKLWQMILGAAVLFGLGYFTNDLLPDQQKSEAELYVTAEINNKCLEEAEAWFAIEFKEHALRQIKRAVISGKDDLYINYQDFRRGNTFKCAPGFGELEFSYVMRKSGAEDVRVSLEDMGFDADTYFADQSWRGGTYMWVDIGELR